MEKIKLLLRIKVTFLSGNHSFNDSYNDFHSEVTAYVGVKRKWHLLQVKKVVIFFLYKKDIIQK